jgi:hypothetical protein
MKIRESYLSEVLVLLFAGLSGMFITCDKWYWVIFGIVLLMINSYFFITRLKIGVINEYLKAVEKAEENKKEMGK